MGLDALPAWLWLTGMCVCEGLSPGTTDKWWYHPCVCEPQFLEGTLVIHVASSVMDLTLDWHWQDMNYIDFPPASREPGLNMAEPGGVAIFGSKVLADGTG